MLERNRNKEAAATIAEISAQYDRIALVFQGGGALGAYQAGVYQALADAGCEPSWLSGVSIGAINASIIAGNEPEPPPASGSNSSGETHLRPQDLVLHA